MSHPRTLGGGQRSICPGGMRRKHSSLFLSPSLTLISTSASASAPGFRSNVDLLMFMNININTYVHSYIPISINIHINIRRAQGPLKSPSAKSFRCWSSLGLFLFACPRFPQVSIHCWILKTPSNIFSTWHAPNIVRHCSFRVSSASRREGGCRRPFPDIHLDNHFVSCVSCVVSLTCVSLSVNVAVRSRRTLQHSQWSNISYI